MQKLSLSGAVLKHIALISMLIDHLNKGILIPLALELSSPPLAAIALVLRAVGRWAFPLFFFLLVEGFVHTKDRSRYIGKVCIFAFISEIPFNLFVDGTMFCYEKQNIFFTHLLALCTLYLASEMLKSVSRWKYVEVLITTVFSCAFAEMLGVDYGWLGIALTVAFYLLRGRRFATPIVGYALAAFEQPWSAPAFALLPLYNGERGKQSKLLFYWAYPVHLLLIAGLRMWLFAG